VAFHGKPLEDLNAEDIDGLIGEEETATLDFKAELPAGTEQEKLEFAADVGSMWREGGDIIFGVRDEEGVAVEVRGLPDIDLDAAKLRLDQLVDARVHPRLPSWRFRTVEHPRGPVLVLRIARSWRGPHAVRVNEGFRFPIRGATARKRYLDFEEVRSHFAGGEDLRERVRAFRDRRVAAILSRDTPVPMREGPSMVTHIVPIAAWLERREIDSLQTYHHAAFVPAPRGRGGARGTHEHPNLDGLITYDLPRDEEGAIAYLQCFRDGAFERVTTYPFVNVAPQGGYPERIIPGVWIEAELIHGVHDVLDLLRHVDVGPPIVILPTLLEIREWLIWEDGMRFARRQDPRLAMDVMRLPDLVVDDFDADLPSVLRPIIDTFWQAGGRHRSPSYDEVGNWQI
jgi:hypothetical protein